MWFVKHKMTTHTSAKQKRMDKHNERRTCCQYWIGCYCFCAPCQSWVDEQSEKRNRHNKEKLELLNVRLSRHEDMKRNEEYDLTLGSVVKGVTKSLKRTFSTHNHEAAYGFRDDKGERAMVRTVKLDFAKNPFTSLEETFKFFDGDNSGLISRVEFVEAMDRLDHNHDAEEVEDMMNQMDLDDDGMISFAEFSQAMAHINFQGEGEKAHQNMPKGPRLSSEELNMRAAEIAARSDTLTLVLRSSKTKKIESLHSGNPNSVNSILNGDIPKAKDQELVQYPNIRSINTLNSEMLGNMANTEFKMLNEEYNDLPTRTESIYKKNYSWSPGDRSGIREKLAARRKNRQSHPENSRSVTSPTVIKLGEFNTNFQFVVNEGLPSNSPSPDSSDEFEYVTRNIVNDKGLKASPVMLD